MMMNHNSSQPPVLLTNADVRRYLEDNVTDLVPLLENALTDFSNGNGGLINPVRTTIAPNADSFFMAMPVYYEAAGVFTCKLISSVTSRIPGQTGGLNAALALFNCKTGQPLAFMEAEALTAFRTAIVTYLSAKHLLKSSPPEKVAIIGTGTQAAMHAQIFATLLKPKVISVWGLDHSHAIEFCNRWKGVCFEKSQSSVVLSPAKSVNDACESAQFIVTCTSSSTPVLPRAAVTESCGLISIVGAPTRTAQEAEAAVLLDCVAVYADSREAASSESGDVINSGREIYAELGEVIAGTKKCHKARGYAVFKSQGLAVEDAVASKLVYDRYKAEKC